MSKKAENKSDDASEAPTELETLAEAVLHTASVLQLVADHVGSSEAKRLLSVVLSRLAPLAPRWKVEDFDLAARGAAETLITLQSCCASRSIGASGTTWVFSAAAYTMLSWCPGDYAAGSGPLSTDTSQQRSEAEKRSIIGALARDRTTAELTTMNTGKWPAALDSRLLQYGGR